MCQKPDPRASQHLKSFSSKSRTRLKQHSGRPMSLAMSTEVQRVPYQPIDGRGSASKISSSILTQPLRCPTLIHDKKKIDVKRSKHFKVLVNPFGGQGHAKKLWEHIAEPLVKAAGCTYDITCTFEYLLCRCISNFVF